MTGLCEPVLLAIELSRKKKHERILNRDKLCVTCSYFLAEKESIEAQKQRINVGINRYANFTLHDEIHSTTTNYLGCCRLFLLAIVRHDALAEAAEPAERERHGHGGSMKYVPEEETGSGTGIRERPANT